MKTQDNLPKTEIQLRKIVREEVRNELSTAKVDLVESLTEIATNFKSAILEAVDKVMGELKKSREEQQTQAYQLSNHSDRIEKLEQILPEP